MVKAPSSTDILAMGPYCPSCQSSLGVPTIQPAPFYGAEPWHSESKDFREGDHRRKC